MPIEADASQEPKSMNTLVICGRTGEVMVKGEFKNFNFIDDLPILDGTLLSSIESQLSLLSFDVSHSTTSH